MDVTLEGWGRRKGRHTSARTGMRTAAESRRPQHPTGSLPWPSLLLQPLRSAAPWETPARAGEKHLRGGAAGAAGTFKQGGVVGGAVCPGPQLPQWDDTELPRRAR